MRGTNERWTTKQRNGSSRRLPHLRVHPTRHSRTRPRSDGESRLECLQTRREDNRDDNRPRQNSELITKKNRLKKGPKHPRITLLGKTLLARAEYHPSILSWGRPGISAPSLTPQAGSREQNSLAGSGVARRPDTCTRPAGSSDVAG